MPYARRRAAGGRKRSYQSQKRSLVVHTSRPELGTKYGYNAYNNYKLCIRRRADIPLRIRARTPQLDSYQT